MNFDPVATFSVMAVGVGLGTLAYQYARGLTNADSSQRLAQVLTNADSSQRLAQVLPTVVVDEQATATNIPTLSGHPIDPTIVNEWRAHKQHLNTIMSARMVRNRAFADFHPDIADPKQSALKKHTHEGDDELSTEVRRYTPQNYIRRTNVDRESGQRYYELVLPINTTLGDILTDISLKKLPNAQNLHRIHLKFSSASEKDVQYTLGNLPAPAADGEIHLNIGDSPILLFKMLTRPRLVFSFTQESTYMPEVVLTMGKLKESVRESLRRVANLAMPLDENANLYTLYTIRNRQNVYLANL